jgi:hypothetical protein
MDLFGAISGIASSAMQASAIKKATQMQIKALERQKKFVYDNLKPEVVNAAALAADKERVENRLALQSQIDPALFGARYTSQQALADIAAEGDQSEGDKLAAQLFEEVQSPEYRGKELSQKLMDRAIEEIDAGATLPPDLQAELVKAGLERSGTVGAGGTVKGLAGTISRKLIANEALALKQARQEQATRLGLASQQLAANRAQILSQVFPQLKGLQVQNAALQGSILQQSNQMVPEAGLGGTDIANIFMARVGATNQLAQSAADAAARGAIQQAGAWSQALGAGAQGVSALGSGIAKGLGQDWSTAGLTKSIFG